MAADIGAVGDRGILSSSSGIESRARGPGKKHSHQKLLVALASSLVVIVAAIACFEVSPGTPRPVRPLASSWTISTIDSDWGSDPSIAIDSNDNVHVSYIGSGGLRYATNTGGSWATSTIGSGGEKTSIALDSADNIHISYGNGGSLMYATNASGSWATSAIDSRVVGTDTSIAVDSHGTVYISYQWYWSIPGEPEYWLKYAAGAGSSFGKTLVDYGGRSNSIAVDSDDWVRIAYRGEYGNLKIIAKIQGGWVVTTLESGTVDRDSFVLDAYNRAHISYYKGSELKYYTDAGGPPTSTIDSGESVIHSSIALDNNRYVHISYTDGQSLKYATKSSSSWVISTIDPNGGGGSSIAIDSAGCVHIAYRDAVSYDLKYATNAEPVIPEFGPHIMPVVAAATLVILIALTRGHESMGRKSRTGGRGG